MKLRSFGCSLIYGSELSDEIYDLLAAGKSRRPPHHSTLTWPAHLARLRGCLYRCHARPGSGNLQIAEHVLTQLATANVESAFYVIGWTFIDRFDYIDQNESVNVRPATTSENVVTSKLRTPWSTIRPDTNNNISKIYYGALHSEHRDKLTTLMNIKLIIDTLQQKNYPFIMTYEDGLIFDQQWHTSPAIIALQEYVKPYMTTFDGDTFVDFAKKNRYSITPMGHPLDEAHAAASELMITVFDTQNTNDR